MDSVAVITQIVDVSDFISGMINLRSITVCLILHQVERQGDILLSRNRIGRKLDKIFMKAEIAIIGQKAGDTPALIIQCFYRKSHTRFYLLIIGVIEMQKLLNMFIFHLIFHLTNDKRFSGMQQIGSIQFLSFLGGIERDTGMHETLILHGSKQILTGEPRLQSIVDDRLLAERILEEREEFRFLFLAHILLERPGIIPCRVALHFHLI